MRNTKKDFSLTECLIVIAIIFLSLALWSPYTMRCLR